MTETNVPATVPELPFVIGAGPHRPDVQWPAPSVGGPGPAADGAAGTAPGVTITAAQLHVADLIEQDGTVQRVTSLRLQGAPPTVSVALTGVQGRRSFSPDTRLHVVRGR